MSAIELRNLSKRIDDRVILQPTSLSIDAGELLVIVGPSGCGKSTLLRLIAGLDAPSEGQVFIDGQDVTALDPASRHVAMVFQSYALYPHLTVAENIAFPLRMAKVERAIVAKKVAVVAATLELTELLDRKPRALSGGQRQRVSIARAIVREPTVLLLDEPLSNLDAGLRVRMRYELARLHQALGTTMVYVTHDQIEAMTLANRIAVMSNGRVEQVGAPIDLYERPETLVVAQAIGSPTINMFSVTVETGGSTASVKLVTGACLPIGAYVPENAAGHAATLGVRPEHLQLSGEGAFGGRVALFERLGPLSFAHLEDASGQAIVAQLPGNHHVALGEHLSFTADHAAALLFDANGRRYPFTPPPSTPAK